MAGYAPLVSNARGEGGVATGIQPQQPQQTQEEVLHLRRMGSWLTVIGRGPKGETAEEMARRAELMGGGNVDFHWDNPEFNEFIERYFLDEEDFL